MDKNFQQKDKSIHTPNITSVSNLQEGAFLEEWKRQGTFFIPSGRRWEEQMACSVCGSSSLVMWGRQLLISQCHGQSRSTVDLDTDMLGSELALCDFCSLTH